MEKRCEQCGRAFDAKLDRARFCSSSCRALASQGYKPVVPIEGDVPPQVSSGLLDAVIARVTDAGLLGTTAGESAIDAARRLVNANDTSYAGIHRQLQVSLAAVDAAVPQQSSVDELRLRRDRKRARGA